MNRASCAPHVHAPLCLLSSAVGRQYGVVLAITLTGLIVLMLLLGGCSSKPRPTGVYFPITNGFHTRVPTEQQRILIWGDPSLITVAHAWLTSHHYSHILVPQENARAGSDRETAFTLATELQAEFVLLLEREERKEGSLLEPHCGAGFNITVTARGLSLASREPVFRGSAYYPHCVDSTQEIAQNLTCQALATAWGFRPSGQLEIPSSLACTTGQTPLSSMH